MEKLSIPITVWRSIDEICRKIGQISQFSVIFRKYPIFWAVSPFFGHFFPALRCPKKGYHRCNMSGSTIRLWLKAKNTTTKYFSVKSFPCTRYCNTWKQIISNIKDNSHLQIITWFLLWLIAGPDNKTIQLKFIETQEIVHILASSLSWFNL